MGPGQPPGKFAYADPPFPGLSAKYYRDHKDFKGEVDPVELIESLQVGGYLGWALPTSPRAVRDILPMCPPEARPCAWIKPRQTVAGSGDDDDNNIKAVGIEKTTAKGT